MKTFIEKLAIFTGWLAKISFWLSGTILVVMTAIIFGQVFVRYMLNSSLMWSEPGSVMLMGWFILLGAAVGIRDGSHLSFDVLIMVLPDKAKPWFYSLSDLAVTGFGVGMIVYGMQLVIKTAPNDMPTLGISDAFNFLPLVFGGVLFALFSVERILRRMAGFTTPRFGDASPLEE